MKLKERFGRDHFRAYQVRYLIEAALLAVLAIYVIAGVAAIRWSDRASGDGVWQRSVTDAIKSRGFAVWPISIPRRLAEEARINREIIGEMRTEYYSAVDTARELKHLRRKLPDTRRNPIREPYKHKA